MTTTHTNNDAEKQPFGAHVTHLLGNYFKQLGDNDPNNLYDFVMEEVEIPLLKAVMDHTNENQSRTARMLGLSRGTLRTKLKQYFGERYIKPRQG